MKKLDIPGIKKWLATGTHKDGTKPDCWVDEQLAAAVNMAENRTSQYSENPSLFYRDMRDIAEYLKTKFRTEAKGLSQVIYDLGCKFSEEGATTEQELRIADVEAVANATLGDRAIIECASCNSLFSRVLRDSVFCIKCNERINGNAD